MSRGPGRLERAIEAAFAAEPENAFTVADLCDRAFPQANRIEKKHRVAMLRAMRSAAGRDGRLAMLYAESQGMTLVIFDRTNVASYAMARLKTAFTSYYRPTDRVAQTWHQAAAMKRADIAEQERLLRERLEPGGRDHHLIVPGGAWWGHVKRYRAAALHRPE